MAWIIRLAVKREISRTIRERGKVDNVSS